MNPFAVARGDRRQDYGQDRYILLGMVQDRVLAVAYTQRRARVRIISARLAEPRERRRYHQENSYCKGKPKIDWSRVNAMTEAERHAAAMADPDARPMTEAEWARAPRVPQVQCHPPRAEALARAVRGHLPYSDWYNPGLGAG